MSQDCEVLVVGGGPVGVKMLAELGHAGVRTVGIEMWPEMWKQARAVHFDAEAMRSFQSIGLAAQVSELTSPMRHYRMENEAGDTLLSFATGQWEPQAWHGQNLFHQPEIDALLRAEVERLPSVELRLGTTLLEIDQDDDGVHCHVETVDGTRQTITARWVVACDGANSTVREALGIPVENLGVDDPWLVADGQLHGALDMEGDMVLLGRHTRPALFIRLPGDRARIELKVLPGDDPDEIITPAGIARLSKGLLTPENFTPDRRSIYTFRARIAERWRVGNVFLAGDAAHQAPPLFGQGLCAGMRDVSNLVWKLRLVADGRAPESLLDTYESERRPHAWYWVNEAAMMANLVQTTDPEVAARRDAFVLAEPEKGFPADPALGPGLHAGSVDREAGRLSIQPMLADGTRLDDLVGRRFLLAASPQLLAELPEFVRTALENDPEIAVVSSPEHVGVLLDSVVSSAVLVRPDRYVLGTAQTTRSLEDLLRLLPFGSGLPDSPLTATTGVRHV
ncbi:bifunctional 3-(3-hydroxy-phenyl)propionate/3-hydroxycinnamic acid hydroxylase [Streptomyces sp. NBC_00117]|uniref:bifunctional 3-(3-hydroxy-phenyl)propionate/3-hydroxycinnamic acid hydroxylase n=1 Tax=unclassified Streptomyces TaxID=2593676 RepID=UPI00225143C0|nr:MULTISPECIES: bifunctional 3-(3-hydroxy-phenyl)propionate/3-hydroxycinnamic acid hydroxylase [unclassified Streptomyces]MCX5435608.1 bifunctional 3-(3-hydroxy-phenyl)propionate/3-hydroxycinnamic acid hydroxylase [Streptomyces sp. NBC_00063]WSE08859.1 bifunctional 3-(3-hydroxy-phenyl)propionate/3-hydroxycinnamic acid hydroxylase [Streptomyces sp. NBC_01445]